MNEAPIPVRTDKIAPASRPQASISWIAVGIALAMAVLLTIPMVIGGGWIAAKNTNRMHKTLAQISSAWLSDRLAFVPGENRISYLHKAAEKMGLRAGLFDAGGNNLDAGPLRVVSRDLALQTILLGRETLEIGGDTYIVASATLRPPLSALTIISAVKKGGGDAVPMAHLIPALLGLILLLAGVALVALCFGHDFRSQLAGLAGHLRGAVRDPARTPRRSAMVSFDEMDRLGIAVAGLRARFEGEMALYLDARDEVELMDGQRTGLLTSVAADLNEPLGRVTQLAASLQDDSRDPLSASQLEDVRIIQQAALRLKELVSEIVDLSGLMGGEIEFDQDPVDLAEVAAEVLAAARGQIGKKDIVLCLRADSGERFLVRGSRRRLWQVVTNLVSNALKFTERGQVEIALLRGEADHVKMDVSDTGIGIAAVSLSSVFDPFQQAGGRSGKKHGTGLGLAICKHLVLLHGGEITVKSKYKAGSTFTVVLPGAP